MKKMIKLSVRFVMCYVFFILFGGQILLDRDLPGSSAILSVARTIQAYEHQIEEYSPYVKASSRDREESMRLGFVPKLVHDKGGEQGKLFLNVLAGMAGMGMLLRSVQITGQIVYHRRAKQHDLKPYFKPFSSNTLPRSPKRDILMPSEKRVAEGLPLPGSWTKERVVAEMSDIFRENTRVMAQQALYETTLEDILCTPEEQTPHHRPTIDVSTHFDPDLATLLEPFALDRPDSTQSDRNIPLVADLLTLDQNFEEILKLWRQKLN